MTRKSHIVVGAGLAGLTAAVALAERGASVALHEQSRNLGGRAVTQHEQGFALNLGPHALYQNGELANALRRWQIPFPGRVPNVSGKAHLVVGKRKFAFPASPARLFLTGALRPSEKLAAARALQLLSTLPPASAAALTADEWLDQNVRSAGVRQLVEAFFRLSTYSNAMRRLSAAAALRQFQTALKGGVLYVDGGWETLVTGLRAKAESLGVRIFTRAPAEHVEPGLVTLASGERLPAGGIVLAIPPDAVRRLTGCRLPPLIPVRFACLDLCLRNIPGSTARFALGLDQPYYFSMHSAFAALAPPAGTLIQMGKYVTDESTDTQRELEEFAELLIPGWRDHVVTTRYLPSMTVSHGLLTPAGRPEVNALPLNGVMIAGDWVGNQHMLADAAAASAQRAAAELLESQASAAA